MAIDEFVDRSIGQVIEGSRYEEYVYNRRLWPDAVESSVFTEHAHENTSFARRRRVLHTLAAELQPEGRKKRWSLASHTSKRSTTRDESSVSPWRRLSSLLSGVGRPSQTSGQSSTTISHSMTCPGPPRRLEVPAGLGSHNDSGQGCEGERERDIGTSTLDPARATDRDEEPIQDRVGPGRDIRSRLRRLPARIFVFRDEVASRTYKRFSFLLGSNGDQSEARRRRSLPPDFSLN